MKRKGRSGVGLTTAGLAAIACLACCVCQTLIPKDTQAPVVTAPTHTSAFTVPQTTKSTMTPTGCAGYLFYPSELDR